METLPLLRMLASLAVTLGLMLLFALAYKRYGTPFANTSLKRTEPRLNVLESKRLNPTTTLYLVQHDATEHLLAVTNGQTTVISSTTTSPKTTKAAKVKA